MQPDSVVSVTNFGVMLVGCKGYKDARSESWSVYMAIVSEMHDQDPVRHIRTVDQDR